MTLRESVARALHDDAAAMNHWCPQAMDHSFAASRKEWLVTADAAIAIVLAECVRVAELERIRNPRMEDGRCFNEGINCAVHAIQSLMPPTEEKP